MRCFLIFFSLLSAFYLKAQDYIPLIIDSNYIWSWSISKKGDTLINENWIGFTYDANNTLIQTRTPIVRSNYSYSTNTELIVSEKQNANGDWENYLRKTSVFNNGKISSILTETFANNAWNNSSLETYSYNSFGLETLKLIQHWQATWANFYKREKTYNSFGDNIEIAEYYVDNNGILKYNRGNLLEYDESHHIIQNISINSGVNGAYYLSRNNWLYGDDNLLDTFQYCKYAYPSNTICNLEILGVYTHFGQDSTIEDIYNVWNINNQLAYYGKEVTYNGPEIYSNKPDSVIFYKFNQNSSTYYPSTRRYIKYEELGNGRVYYRDEYFNYSTYDYSLRGTSLTEEWYHDESTSNTTSPQRPSKQVLLYPNPCKKGQKITIELETATNENLEALFTNEQGQLIKIEQLTNQASIFAPMETGITTVFLRGNGRLIGVSKLLVVE